MATISSRLLTRSALRAKRGSFGSSGRPMASHSATNCESFEVVELVLHGDREQPVTVELVGLALTVERPHPDPLGAVDLFDHAGGREGALLPGDLAVARDDLRVDEHLELARLVLVRRVDDEDTVGL